MLGILRQIQGWVKLKGNTDGTKIGNTKDRLNTSATITDIEGNFVGVSSFSELRTVNRVIDVETKFYYNIDTINLGEFSNTTGSASVVNRQAVISTGTDTAGLSQVRTKKTIDYRVSQTIEASTTFLIPDLAGSPGSQTGPSGCRTVIGLFDENEDDGIRWGFDDGSQFFVEWIRSGVTTRRTRTQFNRDALDGVSTVNGEVSEYTPDFTKIQLVRVIYSWHGVTPFAFEIQKPDGSWRLFHVESFVNSLTTANIGIPILPISALAENTGKTTDTQIIWQAGQASFLGNRNNKASSRYFQRSFSKTVSTEAPILTIRNKSTYAASTNYIMTDLNFLTLSSNGNKTVAFKIYRDATLTSPSFVDQDTTNSVIEYDTSATAFSGGKSELSLSLGASDSFNGPVENLRLVLRPGESITVTGFSSNNNDMRVGIRWRELH